MAFTTRYTLAVAGRLRFDALSRCSRLDRPIEEHRAPLSPAYAPWLRFRSSAYRLRGRQRASALVGSASDSWLQRASRSLEGLRQFSLEKLLALVGHDTVGMSQRYTHVGKEALSNRPVAGPYKPPRLVRTGGLENCQELNFLNWPPVEANDK